MLIRPSFLMLKGCMQKVLFRDDELKPAVGAQRTKELIENLMVAATALVQARRAGG